MKTLKITSAQLLINLSLLMIFLTTSCAQSGKTQKDISQNTVASESKVKQPEMDIHSAVLAGNLEVVEQHIKAGSDINKIEPMSGSSPLTTAATFNKIEIAKALINAKADLSIKNNDGSTALHTAAFFGRIEIVQALIDAKADKTIRNNFGATPRETVLGDFNEMKPIYQMLQQQLQPLGLVLDMEELEKARPVIAMMLQ